MSPTWTKSAPPKPSLSRPRIFFLNRCYWPDSEATGQLLSDLCEHLAGRFDVHVICGQPNSPTSDGFVRSGIQQRRGVTIHRLTHTRFAKRMPAGRLINLLSFSRSADRYLHRLFRQDPSQVPDIIVAETDPFLLPVVGAKLSKRTGSRLICYLQDIYPDVAEAIGKVSDGVLTRQIRSRLKAAYDHADRVIVLGSCMQDRLASPPWSIDCDKLQVLPNWANCDAIEPMDAANNPFRLRQDLADRFVVMHSGNMGLTQRLDVLVAATRDPNWPASAVLLLVGDGAAREPLLAASANNDRVRILPYQPREKLNESLSAADLHVVSMHENIAGCLCPSKLYGILAAGRPVLAIASEKTDLVQTVQRYELGWTCDPGDPAQIATLVDAAANDQQQRIAAGKNARAIAVAQFDRRVVMQNFADLLQNVLDPSSQSSRIDQDQMQKIGQDTKQHRESNGDASAIIGDRNIAPTSAAERPSKET